MSPAEFFADHTYRMVFLGTAVIGLVAGALGTFPYLRGRSLYADVISHAALPGALAAFLLVAAVLGGDGRSTLVLMGGAVVTGIAAVAFSQRWEATTRLGVDTTMAVSLTLFFGAGMLLLRGITDHDVPGKGGIQDYLLGNASVLTAADLAASIGVGVLALGIMVLFFKEFALRTVDGAHATLLGFSGRVVDGLMFATVVVATVIGIKAVGLVLMVAFVVTPPAAARQWTRSLPATVALSATIGALGSGLGAYLSIALGGLPTGPLIVLTLFALLLASLLLAPGRSLIGRSLALRRRRAQLLAGLRDRAEVRP